VAFIETVEVGASGQGTAFQWELNSRVNKTGEHQVLSKEAAAAEGVCRQRER
jgi:hypothetical protein